MLQEPTPISEKTEISETDYEKLCLQIKTLVHDSLQKFGQLDDSLHFSIQIRIKRLSRKDQVQIQSFINRIIKTEFTQAYFVFEVRRRDRLFDLSDLEDEIPDEILDGLAKLNEAAAFPNGLSPEFRRSIAKTRSYNDLINLLSDAAYSILTKLHRDNIVPEIKQKTQDAISRFLDD